MIDIQLINLIFRGEQLLEALAVLDGAACDDVSAWKTAVEEFALAIQQPASVDDVKKVGALIELTDRLDVALGAYALQLKAQQEAAQRQYQMAHKYIVNG